MPWVRYTSYRFLRPDPTPSLFAQLKQMSERDLDAHIQSQVSIIRDAAGLRNRLMFYASAVAVAALVLTFEIDLGWFSVILLLLGFGALFGIVRVSAEFNSVRNFVSDMKQYWRGAWVLANESPDYATFKKSEPSAEWRDYQTSFATLSSSPLDAEKSAHALDDHWREVEEFKRRNQHNQP